MLPLWRVHAFLSGAVWFVEHFGTTAGREYFQFFEVDRLNVLNLPSAVWALRLSSTEESAYHIAKLAEVAASFMIMIVHLLCLNNIGALGLGSGWFDPILPVRGCC
jgi:hypothetical protein